MSILAPQFRLGIVAVACLAGGFGCGPATLLERPQGLPARLDGRALWHTPNGYIYATHKNIAGETDRWIGAMNGHVRRTYDAELGKGLVIVVDQDEASIVDSIETLVRLEGLFSRQTGVEKAPSVEKRRQKLEDSGMSDELAFRITPVELDDEALSSAGLPPEGVPADVQWRVVCPSHRVMESAVWEFGPKAIEKRKGKAFVVMTAWAFPLAFPEAAKVLQLSRDALVFSAFCDRQEWTKERRQGEFERYLTERALTLSPLLSISLSFAKSKLKDEGGARIEVGEVQAPASE